jgi:hypothetical protein
MLLRLGDASPEDGGAPQLAPPWRATWRLGRWRCKLGFRYRDSQSTGSLPFRDRRPYIWPRMSSAWASERAWGVCPSALAYADSIAMTQTIGEPLSDDGADAGAVAVPIYPVIRCMRISHRC